jgi:hypothetical protein
LDVWYVCGIFRLHVLHLGGNNEQKDKDELAALAYGLLYLILLAKGSNHSLQEFVVRHSWTEFLQIRNW